MTSKVDNGWRREFGIGAAKSTSFIGNVDELNSRRLPVSHAHVIRRAFALFDLDGVLSDQTSPIVYFKVVRRIQTAEILKLLRKFWNHGGAPILVVVSPTEVQIFSGLTRPTDKFDLSGRPNDLVVKIDRATNELLEFLPSIESGEFFRKHSKSFKPTERVDRALLDNLGATRDKLSIIASKKATTDVLDAFLCRLVFTCYLFDRKIIGEMYLRDADITGLSHLKDILGLRSKSEAKEKLYRLFRKLAIDFNGDLFSDDLGAEAAMVSVAHIEAVDDFFGGTDAKTGQQSFWPYDFEAIPIESISAIYERFLKPQDKELGAFYTPRFLAELVLDTALAGYSSLTGLRFLDPACGSGIFLVGIFNRIAEEWKQENPSARNDRRAKELLNILRSNFVGIDCNPTACRIAAFSLYLAFLDQLTPRDIQDLQAKGRALPPLVITPNQPDIGSNHGGIWCGDFFDTTAQYPTSFDLIVGNPPWGSSVKKGSIAANWLIRSNLAIADSQIAAAFMWKATTHVAESGRICLILPHGILFNHSSPAISFQKSFIQTHSLDRVINLTDYQSFLFSEARHPTLVLSYRRCKPKNDHTIEYWVPKSDWKVLRSEIVTISEHDRHTLTLPSVLKDLDSEDAPQIWKRMSWATSRDRRLLDRLSEFPRLRDHVRQARDKKSDKPWLIAEGFQPLGKNDNSDKAKMLELPSELFIEASSSRLRLFILENDCSKLKSKHIQVRARSNSIVEVFRTPHVLVAKGFEGIAFADFAVSFRHALRGVTGPAKDRSLLVFLAAYLRSPLAQYFQFHTSSNWGVSRQEVHVEELLRLPFPLPEALDNPQRAKAIIENVALIVRAATQKAQNILVDRDDVVDQAQTQIEPLIYEYFDVAPSECVLVKDTVEIALESFRPSAKRKLIPSIVPSTVEARTRYMDRLRNTLNSWAFGTSSKVVGSVTVSEAMGVGLVTLERESRGIPKALPQDNGGILNALDRLRRAASTKSNTFELARGIKTFVGPQLYILKPIDTRFWTETVALNDADEIAGSILMQSAEQSA